MFTNNYIAFRHNLFFGLGGVGYNNGMLTGKSFYSVANANVPNTGAYGGIFYCDFGRCLDGVCRNLLTATTNSHGLTNGLFFGSGTTPATKEDITLESPITSGLSIVSGNFHLEDDGAGHYSLSRDYLVTNDTEEAVTINEIGCFGGVPTDNNTFHQVLWERTVLTSPVTIQPGKTKAITYKVTFNQP